ncbi:MAG: type II secretion system GspH family protein, partial [Chthoniobacterales bacterium]|nr:type II secretion system GspH family protein [Chthoniobacterales bacterium]
MMLPYKGYTLVETLIAAGILLFVLATAASLSFSLVRLEDDSQKSAVAINYAEQAGRLWQLGINNTTIQAILPPNPHILSLQFSTHQNLSLQDGNLTINPTQANLTVTFRIPNTSANRSETF